MAVTDKQLAMLNDKDTIVIIPPSGLESQLAMQWLKANAPKVVQEQRVMDELHLLALQGNIKTCFVFRNPSTPCKEQFVLANGALTDKVRPLKELMDEMLVSKPIEPHFRREHPLKPAILDIPGYLEAVGKELMPYIRLDYVDKAVERPQKLRLTWT